MGLMGHCRWAQSIAPLQPSLFLALELEALTVRPGPVVPYQLHNPLAFVQVEKDRTREVQISSQF